MASQSAIYEHRHQVLVEEIDELQHASNLAYLKWMQAAAIAHSDARGWTTDRYRNLQAGWVVRSHQIEYLQPAFAGDDLVVRTWVADMKKISSLRRYVIERRSDGAQLVIAATNWAFIDFQTRKLTRIPVEVMEAFEILPDGS